MLQPILTPPSITKVNELVHYAGQLGGGTHPIAGLAAHALEKFTHKTHTGRQSKVDGKPQPWWQEAELLTTRPLHDPDILGYCKSEGAHTESVDRMSFIRLFRRPACADRRHWWGRRSHAGIPSAEGPSWSGAAAGSPQPSGQSYAAQSPGISVGET